jgi:DNA repair exonuclease SbcCD ATPase subunit
MTTEEIIGIQVFTFIGYVVTLFGLYRLLVNQKDATIETLRTQCETLKERLTALEKKDPDYLVAMLDKRKNILERELRDISEESTSKKEELQAKISELNLQKQGLEDEVKYVNELLSKYSCPYCKSPLIRREFAIESVETDHGEFDVEHEWETYECGFTVSDGKATKDCIVSEMYK